MLVQVSDLVLHVNEKCLRESSQKQQHTFPLLDVRELSDCLARGIAGRVQWAVARGQRVEFDRAAIGRIAPDIRGSSSSYRAT